MEEYFGVKVVNKEDSLLMKFFALFLTKHFMDQFTTTIVKTIYMPKRVRDNPDLREVVLAHECYHVWDAKRKGKWIFPLVYLTPQVYALFSLLAILAIWWLPFIVFLLCLVFLLPFPSKRRVEAELPAYAISLYMLHKKGLMRHDIAYRVQTFVGSDYYYMANDPVYIAKRLNQYVEAIEDGRLATLVPFVEELERALLAPPDGETTPPLS